MILGELCWLLEVELLLVGRPVSDRSKVMTQIEKHVLVLQVGGWGVRLITSPPYKKKKLIVEKLSNRSPMDNIGKTLGKVCKDKGFCIAAWAVLSVERAVLKWVKQGNGKMWNCSVQGNNN